MKTNKCATFIKCADCTKHKAQKCAGIST